MSEGRPKRVKTTAGINRSLRHLGQQRNLETGGSSSAQVGIIHVGRDPYYSLALQAERLSKFIGLKQTYIRYANMTWMVEQGEITKDGSMTVENRLLHGVQGELTNVGSSETLTMLNRWIVGLWIFISPVIEHVGIDTSNEDIIRVNHREHLLNDSSIHKMSIYKYGEEDYQTTIEILYEEEDIIPVEPTQPSQPGEAPNMLQEPSFGLAHLDSMEQHLNEHIDSRMQSMEERLMADFHRQELEKKT
ncbi:hypothetical protein Lal_00038019, partial [Lupinus albus]